MKNDNNENLLLFQNTLFLNKFYILLIKKFNKARIKKEIINLLV